MKDDSLEKKIVGLVQPFRAAIMRCGHEAFKDFPFDCCGTTCSLLGRHLAEHDIEGFRVVEASHRGKGPSHAWLERNGLIVDITLNQYGDQYPPVIVTKQSAWHEGWEPHHEWDADYRTSEHIDRKVMDEIYESIVRHLR